MDPIFSINLPVPVEKQRHLLHNGRAESVRLNFLSFPATVGPGVEFVFHGEGPKPRTNRISLFLASPLSREFRDEDGNLMEFIPGLERAIIVIRTGDRRASAALLEKCGFSRSTLPLPQGEKKSGVNEFWSLENALFPRLAARLALVEDKGLSVSPKVDEIGWNGLSFLCRDLDAVASRLPLRARQTFTGIDGSRREIAFHSGDGLLMEFLRINP